MLPFLCRTAAVLVAIAAFTGAHAAPVSQSLGALAFNFDDAKASATLSAPMAGITRIDSKLTPAVDCLTDEACPLPSFSVALVNGAGPYRLLGIEFGVTIPGQQPGDLALSELAVNGMPLASATSESGMGPQGVFSFTPLDLLPNRTLTLDSTVFNFAELGAATNPDLQVFELRFEFSQALAVQAVPEPASALLACTSLLILASRRRRFTA